MAVIRTQSVSQPTSETVPNDRPSGRVAPIRCAVSSSASVVTTHTWWCSPPLGAISTASHRLSVEWITLRTGPVARSFHEALRSERGDSHLAILRGANHFSCAHPADGSTGRPFLDWPCGRPDEELRADLEALVTRFARAYVLGDSASRDALLASLRDQARITLSATR